MNNILTNLAVDPSKQQPWTVKSLNFLQVANKQAFEGVCRGLMGTNNYNSSATVGVAVAGCEYVGTSFSAGYIFYAGELYYISPTSTAGFTNPPVIVNNFSFDPSVDPITFSDQTTGSVHQNRWLMVADQPTGLFTLASLIYIKGSDVKVAPAQLDMAPLTTNGQLLDIPSTSFTVPNLGNRRYKITLSGVSLFTTAGGAPDGAIVRMYSGATNVVSTESYVNVPAAAAPASYRFPFTLRFKTDVLAAGTVIKCAVQKQTGTSTQSHFLTNMYYTIEEY